MKLGPRIVLVTVSSLTFGCSSSSDRDGGPSAGGSIGNPGGAGGGAGGTQLAGASGTQGGGTGGQVGGAGGVQTGGTTQGGSGGVALVPGADCAYTDNTSNLNAITEPDCDTGYCLWDGRYLGESYCTIACSGPGAVCPDGYECDKDLHVSGKYWCARTPPTPPADLGAACSSVYLSECTVTNPSQNFCLAPYVDSCEDRYCVYDGASKTSYCSTPCRAKKVPCPDGWDCWPNPSYTTGIFDTCIMHHQPAAYVGLSCQIGPTYGCQGDSPCVTKENATVPSCGLQNGICVFDPRNGMRVEYCSMRCETDACPTGYDCMSITMDTGAAPQALPSGMYCVKHI